MNDAIRVLHVDDEPDFAEMAGRFLEREDERIEVVTASSASEGLDRLATTDVDCVVADYDMPGRNGIELLEAVREDHPDVPFILFTGKGSEEVASDAISAGVTDYLQKERGADQFAVLANRVVNAVGHARSKRRVERSERRLREVVDLLPHPLYVTDAEGTYLLANESLAAFHGTTVGEIEGANVTDVLPGAAAERFLANAREVIETGGRVQPPEVELTGDDGERRIFAPRLLPVEFGGEQAVLGIAVDVTERWERERELRRNERRFEAVFEDPRMLVGLLDTDGTLVDANRRSLAFVDADREEVTGRPFWETPWWGEETREEVREWVERAASGEYVEYDADLTTPDGEPYSVAGTIRPVTDDEDEVDSLIVSAHDVTERRERERELERYRRIFEAMGDGLYTTDAEGNYTEVNEQLAEMLGYDREEMLAADPEQFLGEEGVATFENAIQDLLADNEEEIATVEATAERRNGEEFHVEATLTLITEDGEFRGNVGVVRDVTERKEREQELERYETIVRTIPDVVAVLDNEGRHQMINNMGRTGYTREELIGSHFSITTPAEDVETAERIVAELIQSGERDRATFEQDLVTKDGEHIPHESRLALLPPDEEGRIPGVVSVLRDISERKEREQELQRQNERLEEFSSVVSHDLRNPLNVAAGHVDLLAEECDSERIETVQQAHERMERIIEDTLALARQGEAVGETEPVDLDELAEECWRNVETDAATLHSEPVTVVADPDRVRNLLENLFRNAVEHGSTSPRSRAREDTVAHAGPEVTIRVGGLDDGFYVADDGPGIQPEEREDVFEAGFSTEEDGTGFGLSIVRQIAEAHGWSVRAVESETGGARFEFTGVEVE